VTGGGVLVLQSLIDTLWQLPPECCLAPLDPSVDGAYDASVLACMTLAGLLPLLLTRRARDRVDRIASSRWVGLR
jgi:hypothetical protein